MSPTIIIPRQYLPDDDATIVARIVSTWDAATPAERADGYTWYPSAGRMCDGWSAETGIPVATCRAILAVTSQRNGWTRNVRWTAEILRTGVCTGGGLGQVVDRVNALLAGADPGDVVDGKKVCAFHCNIGGCTYCVTNDRHMFDLACGRQTDDRTRKALDRVGVYEHLSDLVREAAAKRFVTPAVMQAGTWVTWRRMLAA